MADPVKLTVIFYYHIRKYYFYFQSYAKNKAKIYEKFVITTKKKESGWVSHWSHTIVVHDDRMPSLVNSDPNSRRRLTLDLSLCPWFGSLLEVVLPSLALSLSDVLRHS